MKDVVAALALWAAFGFAADALAQAAPTPEQAEKMNKALQEAAECAKLPQASYQQQTEKMACFARAASITPPSGHSWTAEAVTALEKPGPATAQGGNELVRHVMVENAERSYITAGSGWRMNGDRTSGDILYEAQVARNFGWLSGEAMGQKLWLDLPIRLGLRQLTTESLPVRTPSYNPGIRLFMAPMAEGKDAPSPWYFSAGLHHYSNGQDGSAATSSGAANVQNGTFSTNYFELAAHRFGNWGAFQWARASWRQHFIGTWEPFQRGQYEKGHVTLEGRTRDRPYDLFGFATGHTNLRLAGTTEYGRHYIVKNDVNPARNETTQLRDRVSFTAELTAQPRSWKDVAWYVRYDAGYDYYNIDFQNRMNRIQFGVVSTNY